MDILKFINENSALCGGIFGIITALITTSTKHFIESKHEKKRTISALQSEVAKLEAQIKRYEEKNAEDQALDKSDGSLYVETLLNGKTRTICGYCWEESWKKTPIVPEWYYDRDGQYETCKCPICERYCRGKNVYVATQQTSTIVDTDELPF